MGSRAIYNDSPKMEKIKNEVNAALDLINAGPGPRPRSSPADPPMGMGQPDDDGVSEKKVSGAPKIIEADIITKVKMPLEGYYMGSFDPGVYIKEIVFDVHCGIRTYDKYILCVFALLADNSGVVNLSQVEISKRTSISRSSLIQSLKNLVKGGVLKKTFDLRNQYQLVPLSIVEAIRNEIEN